MMMVAFVDYGTTSICGRGLALIACCWGQCSLVARVELFLYPFQDMLVAFESGGIVEALFCNGGVGGVGDDCNQD